MVRFHTIARVGVPGQIDVPFTPEEELARDKEEAEYQAREDARSGAVRAKAELRTSALSKLQALGLSLEEISALNIAE